MLGFYCRIMTCFCMVMDDKDFAFDSVLIARDHDQN